MTQNTLVPSLFRWFRSGPARKPRAGRGRAHWRAALGVERFEDRTVPALVANVIGPVAASDYFGPNPDPLGTDSAKIQTVESFAWSVANTSSDVGPPPKGSDSIEQVSILIVPLPPPPVL